MISTEDQRREFLKAVDAIIPSEVGGDVVCTDRVLNVNQDAAVLQVYRTPDGVSLYVTASGLEIATFSDSMDDLAMRRVKAAAYKLLRDTESHPEVKDGASPEFWEMVRGLAA